MQARLVVLLAWLTLALPLDVQADGKVFSQVTAVKTVTPDQRALLHYANGIETLVVETTFVGAGTNFAWVVPLPTAPEITAVPRTVFTNLEMLFRPEIIHKQTKWWMGALYLSLFGIYYWHGRVNGSRGAIIRGFFLALLILGGLAGMTLPALGKLDGSPSTITVQVLSREAVGSFETVTLSSPDGIALTRWLNEHGFAIPTTAIPVITDYAKQGWVFAAAKLRRTNAMGKASPHPLAFKFKTDRAVYPLRLTGVENERCMVEVYVFGESRAELTGFKVEQCLATEFPTEMPPGTRVEKAPDRAPFREPSPGQLRVRHPTLRSLVADAPIGTKLGGTLDAESMSRDLFVAWVPFQPQLASFYSYEAATTRSVNVGVAGLLLLLLGVGLWLGWKDREWTGRMVAIVIATAHVIGAVCFVLLPKVEVQLQSARSSHWLYKQHRLANLHKGLDCLADELRKGTKESPPEGWNLATLVAATDANLYGSWTSINPLTNNPLREEATPGNVLFRKTETGTEVIWHDVDCVEHVLGTLPVRAP